MDSVKSFQEVLNITSTLFERKKKLIDIVIGDSDFKTKLQKLRRTLLEFQTDSDITIGQEFIQNIILEKDVEKINNATRMIEMTTNLVKDQKKLFSDIADVIRSDLTDEQKVEKITDLLL